MNNTLQRDAHTITSPHWNTLYYYRGKVNDNSLIGLYARNGKSGLNEFTEDAPTEDTCKGSDDQWRVPPKPYSSSSPVREFQVFFSVNLGQVNEKHTLRHPWWNKRLQSPGQNIENAVICHLAAMHGRNSWSRGAQGQPLWYMWGLETTKVHLQYWIEASLKYPETHWPQSNGHVVFWYLDSIWLHDPTAKPVQLFLDVAEGWHSSHGKARVGRARGSVRVV